ncbi:sigma-54 dependent transcriptional regulator [Flammeovirga yaeyamensis]|uniref:Sigma-54 dependent transcriptional regulator n=1 Tax=Flammeovirga yaeyamensis TaxID=367791 RepID=A0AAX1N5A3_9BACT|nr:MULTISPECIES: sigma-54 dependent transcriptional regulator [Flammeovirga]ANQ51231.1 sigma-54-dependent Fis family transcriptional regulator [Flammeovirga sp. MY04]MBB3698287.1 DNA-binding NtrC family response regulator [Flammeovirga yaeyamensis]NMF34359.1 sigma-54-dependent Fis family transcriptional regulator [Flammeovirga yaeyamensis]QWG01340.1 sigma-54 dependent transcriptional regulator [Flammeovirga yaeyamensis]
MSTSKRFKIFALEDNAVFSKMLNYILSMDDEHEVVMFEKGRDLLNSLDQKPTLITVDYSLPDMTGEEVIQKISMRMPNVPVIVISGQTDVKIAVKLFKYGVYDYITKDEDIRERLLNAINKIKVNESLIEEVEHLREELSHKYEFDNSIIGNSLPMKKVFQLLHKTSDNAINVSITGETGTGKEVVAKAIHYNSNRAKKPFVAVNIAAIPTSLLESELFGHEKGAFTGAISKRIGKFEEANGGTIFLDEIGEMEMSLQAKLLRVIQEREVVRIGGNQIVKLDVRIITATHRDLSKEMMANKFREDLFYRLMGVPIYLPPLRERGNDVILLAKHLLEQFIAQNQLEKVTITSEAKQKLLDYQYPGNIRELKAIIELAAVMCEGNKIQADDLQFSTSSDLESVMSKEMTLKEYNFEIIQRFLKRYDDNVAKVAKKLDIGKVTIYRYLKEIELSNKVN